MKLYPLRFDPVYCYRIWGGEKLKTELLKDYEEESIGESWEISAVSGYETRVSEGPHKGKTLTELISEFQADLMGKKVYEAFGIEFPLLVKYIDAAKPLSIQVHPSDDLALERHDSFGKNEMWYVMATDPGAELVIGFNKAIDKKTYQDLLDSGSIMKVMNRQQVKPGDTFYIPTGRVHAIGAGVLLAEIQQTSDITYRIYDYDRVDGKTGKKRELHNELALEAIDFGLSDKYDTEYPRLENVQNPMVQSPYFTTNFLPVKGELKIDHSGLDSFVIYMCVSGKADLECHGTTYTLNLGETLLVPAVCDEVLLKGEAELLEVFI